MSKQPYRIADHGRIDRSRPISFSFDGKNFQGFEGDTLASALLSNGVSLVGRSFKYHRPRGIYSAGIEEPNALVSLRTGDRFEPNVPATVIELYDGLEAVSQNRWPSLNHDVMSVVGLFSKALSAGFYYKTFMGPTRKSWLFYEHFIRNAAGMGDATSQPDPDRYEKAHGFCDVLVVGSGPSGLAAALAAGRSGARVILVEDDVSLGGALLSRPRGGKTDSWLSATIDELAALPNVRIMNRTTVYGAYDQLVFGLVERVSDHTPVPEAHQPRHRHWTIRTRRAVIAAGMIERPIVFGNNDLPGIMLASAARTYVNRFGVVPGRRVVAFTNNDSAYDAALDIAAAGADVTVVDVRNSISSELKRIVQRADIKLHLGSAIAGARGKRAIKSVELMNYEHESSTAGKLKNVLPCDMLIVSGGWTPTLHLLSQRGPKPVYDEKLATLVADATPEGYHLVGAAATNLSVRSCVESGLKAGAAAAEACGFSSASAANSAAGDLPGESDDIGTVPVWEVPNAIGGKSRKKFVDLQHDVKADDVSLAYREGYDSVELLKRYTTLGMAADQGKIANLNALAILANRHDKPIGEVGTTTFRPPYRPIAVGAIAGQETGLHFKPTRRTPMHDLHSRNGVVFTQTGLWDRPWYFPEAGENTKDAYIREAGQVRKSVGIVDVSSLGKIDVQGPDAAEFLNRVYVNGWDTLKVGKARYGAMLRPDGIVVDDGTTSRLSENHYFMTTTTGGAGKVMTYLEYLLQTAWPDLKVHVTSVTGQWAAMAVAGPKTRDLLSSVVKDVDFSNESFPFMGVTHGHIGDIPVRLLRMSFSGEMAYEVYTPAGYGEQVWQTIYEAGKAFDIVRYGTEALGTLRIEKGHVAGPEIEGRTTLADLGLGRMASKKKPFIGSTLMQREGLQDPSRPQLVGLETADGKGVIKAGSILCEPGQHTGHGIGWVASVTYSPELGKNIALGLVSGGLSREGKVIDAAFPLHDEITQVRVISPHMVDPKGERLNA